MLGALTKFVDQSQRVVKASNKAAYANIQHAAASIRKEAIASIQPDDAPSPPGKPPHTRKRFTRKGKQITGHLPRAITFAADKATQTAVVGPRASIVGESASAHEFGGEYKDQTYPERPFMSPALEKNLDRFAASFAGSIGE